MTTDNAAGESSLPDYPDLFQQYVLRSVALAHAAIKAETPRFSTEAGERALHVLSYALGLDRAWPSARNLLLLLAPKMEQAGHRDDWLPYLERGVVLSQVQEDQQAEGELCLYLGELLRLRSKFELARQWLNTSIATFTALGENQGQARALNQLAYVAWQQHHYDEAESLAQRALTLLDEDDIERATCFSRLGLVAIDQQQWKEAEHYHRDALRIRQKYDDQRKIAWSLQNLGYALRGQGKYEEAIDYYEQAIAILEDVQDIANCANVQVNLGIVYWLAEQPTKALEIYSLAERTYRELQDTHNLAKIFNNKGLGYRDLCNWVQAESAFITSITLHEAVGDFSLRLESLDELGLVYLGQGQYDKASTTFESVRAALPQIVGTPTYAYLAEVLPTHLAQAKQKIKELSK